MQISSTEKYFLFTLLLITSVLTLLIFYPFLAVFILSVAFAVVLSPVYSWIKKYLAFKISWLASLLTIILFILCLCVPLFFVGKEVFYQTQNLYNNVVASGNSGQFINSIDHSINKLLPDGFNFDVHSKIVEIVSSLSNNLANFFSSTLNSIAMFLLMVFSLFYLLKDGEKWKNGFIKIFPLSDENTNEILSNIRKSINRIFKGSFIIAIVQGILAWIGFSFFGVPNAIIWAVVACITSLIPTVGTSLVTIPAILFLFFTGMHLHALGLLAWALLIVATVDNILNPYIISGDSDIPSLFILFSILGAIILIGPLGILIGPLVLSLLYSLISIYKKEIHGNS